MSTLSTTSVANRRKAFGTAAFAVSGGISLILVGGIVAMAPSPAWIGPATASVEHSSPMPQADPQSINRVSLAPGETTVATFALPSGYLGDPVVESNNRSVDITGSTISRESHSIELKNFSKNPQVTDLTVTWAK